MAPADQVRLSTVPPEELAPEVEFACPEPGCDGRLRRRYTKYGLRYLCSRWVSTRCPGALSCHVDGRPMGIPADIVTRRARERAHSVFDQLWKSKFMPRKQAYRWLALRLGIEEAHMGEMTLEQCEQVVRLVATTPGAKRQ